MRCFAQIFVLFVAVVSSVHGATVQIVASSDLGKPAQYGISKLREAIASRGIQVVVSDRIEPTRDSHLILTGLASDPSISKRTTGATLVLPESPESCAIGHIRDGQRHNIVLCGADPVGLMYAALDTFVQSARVYGGDSFEVNEMLATKMLGRPHDAEPFQVQTAAYQLAGLQKTEFLATTADLKILAHLAQYHAARMRAAVWYNVYLQARNDQFDIEQCLAAESNAIAASGFDSPFNDRD